MLTVAQAADRVGRSPETIRRWIHAGRLRSRRVGRRYMIDEADLLAIAEDHASVPFPPEWDDSGSAAERPDWVRIIRDARDERTAQLLEVLRTRR